MNLVSVLIAPAIVSLTIGEHANDALRYLIAIIAVIAIVAAVSVSKARSISIGDDSDDASGVDGGTPTAPATESAPVPNA
jgi:K(+)-stimulated pyrophosphate-energized sodium pump